MQLREAEPAPVQELQDHERARPGEGILLRTTLGSVEDFANITRGQVPGQPLVELRRTDGPPRVRGDARLEVEEAEKRPRRRKLAGD